MKHIFRTLATLGPLGWLPAQGTFGTLAALPCVYYLFPLLSWPLQLLVSILLMCGAHIIILGSGLVSSKNPDPDSIIIDELVGFFVTCIGIKISAPSLLLGFVLFRFFDITKPLGIRRVEDAPRYTGIVLDDVVAGIVSNCILHLVIYLC